jgi:hypothetical protein
MQNRHARRICKTGMDYVALLDTAKAVTAGIKEIVQTLGAKRGKRAPGCAKGGSGTRRSFHRVRRRLVNVAVQVAKLREESERLTANQAAQGVVLISDVRHAEAANYKAKADLLQASLGYLLTYADLERTGAERQNSRHRESTVGTQNPIFLIVAGVKQGSC